MATGATRAPLPGDGARAEEARYTGTRRGDRRDIAPAKPWGPNVGERATMAREGWQSGTWLEGVRGEIDLTRRVTQHARDGLSYYILAFRETRTHLESKCE